MKHSIDLDKWNRKEHFLFFSSFDDPFFGITTMVDCTGAYREAKQKKKSFFLSSLHQIMRAVNETDCFRYRIEEDGVVCYDVIHVSPTIGRSDDTFAFAFFEYNPDGDVFVSKSQHIIDKIQHTEGLCLSENSERVDTIFFSAIPWIGFSDMKHATNFRHGDSIPRISTGKLSFHGEKVMMPVSITVHHGLMDGLHVARFVERLEQIMK